MQRNTQLPTGDFAASPEDLFGAVTHPAFRLGVLDAQSGKPFDHDAIHDRILRETPLSALNRLGYPMLFMSQERWIEIAQARYEEGRLAVTMHGVRCKSWGHPDYPPAAVMRLVSQFASERRSSAAQPQPATT